jgi:hypothetical protein
MQLLILGSPRTYYSRKWRIGELQSLPRKLEICIYATKVAELQAWQDNSVGARTLPE